MSDVVRAEHDERCGAELQAVDGPVLLVPVGKCAPRVHGGRLEEVANDREADGTGGETPAKGIVAVGYEDEEDRGAGGEEVSRW